MFPRAVAVLLALVLVWAGFATQEIAVSLAWQGQVLAQEEPAGDSPHHSADGSVDDHHLDDQPAQTHAENPADQPGLFLAGPMARSCAPRISKPNVYVAVAFAPPYLEAAQRPPCAPAVLG